MPSRFIVRDFRNNFYYHVLNKGIDNKNIFLDKQDYRVFLFYLFIYTSSLEKVKGQYKDLPTRFKNKNLHGEIELLANFLMPNHFHLIFLQKSKNALSRLMKQLSNGYTTYFNQKYKHRGGIFLGRYKAVGFDNALQANKLVQQLDITHKNDEWSWFDNAKIEITSQDNVDISGIRIDE